MAEAKQGAAPKAAEKVLEKGLLDQIVEEGRMAKDSGAKERGKNRVESFEDAPPENHVNHGSEEAK